MKLAKSQMTWLCAIAMLGNAVKEKEGLAHGGLLTRLFKLAVQADHPACTASPLPATLHPTWVWPVNWCLQVSSEETKTPTIAGGERGERNEQEKGRGKRNRRRGEGGGGGGRGGAYHSINRHNVSPWGRNNKEHRVPILMDCMQTTH